MKGETNYDSYRMAIIGLFLSLVGFIISLMRGAAIENVTLVIGSMIFILGFFLAVANLTDLHPIIERHRDEF